MHEIDGMIIRRTRSECVALKRGFVIALPNTS
jgi:hypothetical protein